MLRGGGIHTSSWDLLALCLIQAEGLEERSEIVEPRSIGDLSYRKSTLLSELSVA